MDNKKKELYELRDRIKEKWNELYSKWINELMHYVNNTLTIILYKKTLSIDEIEDNIQFFKKILELFEKDEKKAKNIITKLLDLYENNELSCKNLEKIFDEEHK